MTTPETAKCACGHTVRAHQIIVTSKGMRRGACSSCSCRGPR